MGKNKDEDEHIDDVTFHYMSHHGVQTKSLNKFPLHEQAGGIGLGEVKEDPKVEEPKKEITYKTIQLLFGISLLIPKDGGKWKLKSLKKQ